MSTPAQERIAKYLLNKRVDSEGAVRDAAAERHYEAYLLTGDLDLRDAALAIWRAIGLTEETIAQRIREAQRNVEEKDQFDY